VEDPKKLSDPELLAESERVRDELEHGLLTSASRAELGKQYDALGDEYDRRCAPYAAGQ
jgi:hypothetical protein